MCMNALKLAEMVNQANYAVMSYNELVTLNFAYLLAEGDIKPLIEKKRAEARMAEKEMAREQAQIERLQDRLEKLESFTLQNIKPYEEES